MYNMYIYESDKIYFYILGAALILIPSCLLYLKNVQNLNMNKQLESNTDLLEYAESFLSDYFTLTSHSQLVLNFLDNRYLFNFFKNFVSIYPSIEFLLLDFPFEEKKVLINFFDSIKTSSFEDFKKIKIEKKVFYKLLYYINKGIFRLNLE